MCAIVVVEDIDPAVPIWDRERVQIIIGLGLDYLQALHQVRTLLLVLGAPQLDLGATCWCGESVEVPKAPPRIPLQRTIRQHQEVHRAG
ncbi:hypothetical protein ABZ508_26420 [Streptomyces lavendulocolor]|uniref:Uncharacterized protein n=1 Tax=Streptomyces lavendulocolor TaxID=67316 RepID=A0ABV2WC40_9ACTN